MEGAGQSPLIPWHDFYVIVGSSGAALTGLQFVVIALIADSNRKGTIREIEAFGTPTVVHFISVLLISAILSAPWQTLSYVAFILGVYGLVGVIYGVLVLRRAMRVEHYDPIVADWVWYIVLPIVAYITLLVSSIQLTSHPNGGLFVIAAVAVVLLFLGIHNAWDSVTYIAVGYLTSSASQTETSNEAPTAGSTNPVDEPIKVEPEKPASHSK